MNHVIKSCSFENWYDKLHKNKKTVRSKYLPIPNEIIQFLLEDRFRMQDQFFPDFAKIVNESIKELGGYAFVKLNFTAPTDAQWIGPQRTLKVQNFTDIIFLLKGSTRVLLDLTKPFGEEIDDIQPILVLKKYFSYYRDREFRVFQKNRNLRCISSRYCETPCSLAQEEVGALVNEFSNELSDIFPFDNLIFDIYISPKKKLHLIDVAPWNLTASTSRFSWEEIENMDHNEIRLCNELTIRPIEDQACPLELINGTSLDEILQSMKALDEFEDVDVDSIVFDTE